MHNQFGSQGQSQIDTNTSFHFVAYIQKGGTIWEIDGRRAQPLQKGECAPDQFGVRCAELLKGYVDMDSTCQFSLMALAPNQGD